MRLRKSEGRLQQNDSRHISSRELAIVGGMEEDAWRLLEPPPQLFQVPDDASQEIREIVEAFGAHCMAIHDSAMQGADPWASSEEAAMETLREEFQAMPGAWFTDDESSNGSDLEDVPSTSQKGKWTARVSSFAERSSQSMTKLLRSKTLSRATGKGESAQAHSDMVECAGCFDDEQASTFAHLACQHWYCKKCIVLLILNAMSSESQWPPQCCRVELPRSTILLHLSKTQAKAFSEKEAEYATPAKERWYCSRATCGRWFLPQHHGTHVACPHCRHEMCPWCRGPRHDAVSECPQDTSLAALKREAEVEGWTPCPTCRALIELVEGCRHMTCLCGHQFCWVCSARWHTCRCREADKERKLREIKLGKERRRKDEAKKEAAHRAAAEREAAERARREERVLREKAYAEQFEAARTAAIRAHFAGARAELDELHAHQCIAVLAARQPAEEVLRALEDEAVALRALLDHHNSRIRDVENTLRQHQQALSDRCVLEAHWIELAATERAALLCDARDYLLASGGEVPGTMYPDSDDILVESDEDGFEVQAQYAVPGPSKPSIGRMLGLCKAS